GWAVSLSFALTACLISGRLIYLHMANYSNPNQQRYIIRILLMVPIYAIISWLSYYFYAHFIYYELVRDCYEAFVIASFFILLLQYLADTPALQRDSLLVYKGRVMRVAFPFCCFHYDAGSTHYLQFLKYCIMQYVVLRPICTILAVIMQAAGIYCPDSYHPNHGNLWLTIIQTISVTISLYALIQLYMTIKKDIAKHKPLIKFLSVKGIVFLVFWQALLISMLSAADVIKPSEFWSADAIANGISSFLLCVEMVPFAIIHHKAFPATPYKVESKGGEVGKIQVRGPWAAMVDSLNPADLVWEIGYGFKYLFWWVFG
ncbi:organic solute transporter subunit alpha/Transmembrane protein, partial [Piptocephalis cylindrospora]